jgi:hypothetical protein
MQGIHRCGVDPGFQGPRHRDDKHRETIFDQGVLHMELCRVCGRGPATSLVIRRHQGMLVMQRFIKVRASLCRECGMKTTKSYTTRTMVEGWWGIISFFANWFCLAGNLVAYRKAARLAEPRPVEPRQEQERAAA